MFILIAVFLRVTYANDEDNLWGLGEIVGEAFDKSAHTVRTIQDPTLTFTNGGGNDDERATLTDLGDSFLDLVKGEPNVWDVISDLVDVTFTDDELRAQAKKAIAVYRMYLATKKSAGSQETAIKKLANNPWHRQFAKATAVLLKEDGVKDIPDDAVLEGLLESVDQGTFNPVSYYKAASAFDRSPEFQVASEGHFKAPGPNVASTIRALNGPGRRLLGACSACWPWELDQRKCHCACSNTGKEDDGCSAFCPCTGGNTCEAGRHQCRAPAGVGESCHATRPCKSNLSCAPGVHKCYHLLRRVAEPCTFTTPCDFGLSCQPGLQKCYHKPRREAEPCSVGYECGNGLTCAAGSQTCVRPRVVGEYCNSTKPCAAGLSCQPGVQKCYNVPRRFDQPCSAGFVCGANLECFAGIHKCRFSL